MLISRRELLQLLVAGGVVAGTGAWRGLLAPEPAGAATAPRALVVVQLAGGNDGLNTVVPADGRYRDARPTLAVPEADLLTSRRLGAYSLHPALAPILPLVDAGDVAVVHNVGLMHQGRSHFECSQHWWDGSDGHDRMETGWLGRWLDATRSSVTSASAAPLRAVAVGGASATGALRADASPATVVMEPRQFDIRDARLRRALSVTRDEHVVDAMAAVDVLAPRLRTSTGRSSLTADLALAADLVTAGLGVEVVLVGNGEYDTHAGQAATHERLLTELAEGIAAFTATVEDAGMSDRVLLMTTSEFGRRVAENGSAGTDHGLGSCMLAVGSSVRGGVVGDVDLAHLHEGDVHPTVDPRSWLAVGIQFLGGDVDEVFGSWEDLGVLA